MVAKLRDLQYKLYPNSILIIEISRRVFYIELYIS